MSAVRPKPRIGVGLGGNWLIGGSKKAFALQPWCIQGQTGLNWSLDLHQPDLY